MVFMFQVPIAGFSSIYTRSLLVTGTNRNKTLYKVVAYVVPEIAKFSILFRRVEHAILKEHPGLPYCRSTAVGPLVLAIIGP